MAEKEAWIATAIRDSKAGKTEFPFGSMNQEIALRRFSDMMSQPGTVYYLHPEDFDLYSVGAWLPVEAKFVPQSVAHLANGKAVQYKEEK